MLDWKKKTEQITTELIETTWKLKLTTGLMQIKLGIRHFDGAYTASIGDSVVAKSDWANLNVEEFQKATHFDSFEEAKTAIVVALQNLATFATEI